MKLISVFFAVCLLVVAAPLAAAQGTCQYTSDTQTGGNRICHYSCALGEAAFTVRGEQPCPPTWDSDALRPASRTGSSPGAAAADALLDSLAKQQAAALALEDRARRQKIEDQLSATERQLQLQNIGDLHAHTAALQAHTAALGAETAALDAQTAALKAQQASTEKFLADLESEAAAAAKAGPSADLMEAWEYILAHAGTSPRNTERANIKAMQTALCGTRSYPAWLSRGWTPFPIQLRTGTTVNLTCPEPKK